MDTKKYKDYQTTSKKTYSNIATNNHEIIYPTLGLVNEAGEVAGKIKKIFRDKKGEFDTKDIEDLKDELGDVLWYFTQMCSILGLSIEEVAERNLDKLLDRQERNKIKGSGDNR